MKKKLLYLFLVLILLFTAACGKKAEEDDSEQTVTSSEEKEEAKEPINQAIAMLENLESQITTGFDAYTQSTPENKNGLGYDMNLKVEIADEIMEYLNLSGLESVGLNGSLDIKNNIAMNMILAMNDSDVLAFDFFTDSTNVNFNLPKYSAKYATITMEELLGMSTETFQDLISEELEALPTNEELFSLLKKYTTRFVDCFEAGDIKKNETIDIEDYSITGEKHTATASLEDFDKLIEDLQNDLAQYGLLDATTEEIDMGDSSSIILNYYVNDDNEYAIEIYPDASADKPLVFINTKKGFCLCSVQDTGDSKIIICSKASSDNEGEIIILGTEDTDDIVFNYSMSENNFLLEGEMEDLELSIEYITTDTQLQIIYELDMNGLILTSKLLIEGKNFSADINVKAMGISFGTITLEMNQRDYREPATPETTTDLETWTAELDQMALATDFIQLISEYPFLESLLLGTENYEDWDTPSNEVYTPDENYTDDFMNMTGYYMDEEGYVDFEPLEEEVLSIGKPSTGLGAMPVTDAQKKALYDYAEQAIANCEAYSDSYYFVFGSAQYNSVNSYYSTEYSFYNPDNYTESIGLEYDAVSGELSSINIYSATAEEALQIMNDFLEILEIDYTLTLEAAENYDSFQNLNFYAYSGDDYYSISLDVYTY